MKVNFIMLARISKLYIWGLIPSTLLAAESVVLADEATSNLASTLLQGGIGGIVGLIAVKMLLVLYQDKEKNSNEFHSKLLEVIENQTKIHQELIYSNKEMIKLMIEVQEKVQENRALFIDQTKRVEEKMNENRKLFTTYNKHSNSINED